MTVTDRMSSTPIAGDEVRARRAAVFSAMGAAFTGLVVLVVRWSDPHISSTFGLAMKPTAAVAIIFVAAALIVIDRNLVFSRILAGMSLTLGLLTIVERVGATDLGLDQLFFRDRAGTPSPDRMAWETAAVISFLAIGTLLAGPEQSPRIHRIVQTLATAASVTGIFVVLAHLFGASPFRTTGTDVRMAPETAFAVLLLSLALLLRRIGEAWPRLLFADSPPGRLVRRFIPAAVGVALVIAWLRSLAETRGLLDIPTGVAVSATTNILILAGLVLWWGQRAEADHQRLGERDAALITSDERFRLASMATNDAIYDWDIRRGVRTWNDVMSDRYGYPLVDSGRDSATWLERVHPDDRERVARGWATALETRDRVWRSEYRSLRPDGTVDDVLERTFIVYDASGHPIRAIGSITNLTTIRAAETLLRDANVELERRVEERTRELATTNRQLLAEIEHREEIEREIRRQRDFAETLFEASGAVFIVIDRELKIVRLNRAGQRLLGYSMEQLAGRPVIDALTPPENHEKLAALGAQMLGGDVGSQVLIEWVTASGERRTMSWMTSPLLAEDGTVEYLLGAGVDVTAELAAQEQLQRKTERLAAMNAELEAFSYSVSHDLRAPLRSIDGFSQALIEDNESHLDDSGRDHLRRIRNATQKMSELIDGLLELSRVSRALLQKTQVDVSALAAQTIERLREQYPARDVEVVVDSPIVVEGDPRLLRIVMENLIENAWKFTSKTDAARVEVGKRESEGTTEIFVRDNGAGFDPQYASKLFGAFQRLHPASEFPGTGIGLATVQRIVARHGGSLHAEGSPGRGATFSFTIGGH